MHSNDIIKILILCAGLLRTMADDNGCPQCPGLFCGRTYTGNKTDCDTDCGGCKRGYRTDSYFCLKCDQELKLYDWLFIGFMTLCVMVLNFYAIDAFHASPSTNSQQKKVWFLHLCAIIESVVSFSLTILSFEPVGTFKMYSCGVKSIKDWYTIFFNPAINYSSTIHCTQEAVYPLYTSIFMYLLYSLITMMLLRGIVVRLILRNFGQLPLYVGLYILPVVAVIHTCLAGVIYYIFPYLACFLSAFGVAIFLSTLDTEYYKKIRKPRHVGVLVCFGIAHAYGIISITELQLLTRDGPVLLLAFLPFCFYTITRPFTRSDNFKS